MVTSGFNYDKNKFRTSVLVQNFFLESGLVVIYIYGTFETGVYGYLCLE